MIFRVALFVILSLSLISVERTLAAIQCAGIFSPSIKVSAENLNSIDASIMGLAKLRLDIDMAKVQGTSTLVLTVMNSNFSKKEETLWNYLNQYALMTRAEFNAKIKHKIQNLQEQKAPEEALPTEKTFTQKDYSAVLRLAGESAVLHRIEPGTFRMGDHLGLIFNRGIKVTITKPFEMMSTQTTQDLWRKVVSLANLRFPGKYPLQEYPSKNQGDLHPVDMVSYNDVIIWLSALNELSRQGDPLLAQFIRGHKEGDVYRLPTEAERQFVARGRGKYRTNYHFGNYEKNFEAYIWADNSNNHKNHPVAQKLPLTIDGKDFYDMHGNAGEWLRDWWADDLIGGKDPQGPSTGYERVFHPGAGHWWNLAGMSAGGRERMSPRLASSFTSFRFLREVRP